MIACFVSKVILTEFSTVLRLFLMILITFSTPDWKSTSFSSFNWHRPWTQFWGSSHGSSWCYHITYQVRCSQNVQSMPQHEHFHNITTPPQTIEGKKCKSEISLFEKHWDGQYSKYQRWSWTIYYTLFHKQVNYTPCNF